MKFSIQRQINKEAQKKTEALHEYVKDVAHQIARDQEEWIDARMKDLLRPDIYEKAKNDDCHAEVDAYIKKHRIEIVFIPDSMRIRINAAGQQYAEFVPQIALDGEVVPMVPTKIGDVGLN